MSWCILLASIAKTILLNLWPILARPSVANWRNWPLFCCFCLFNQRFAYINYTKRPVCYYPLPLPTELSRLSGESLYLWTCFISAFSLCTSIISCGKRATEGILQVESTCFRLISRSKSGLFLKNFSCSNSIWLRSPRTLWKLYMFNCLANNLPVARRKTCLSV